MRQSIEEGRREPAFLFVGIASLTTMALPSAYSEIHRLLSARYFRDAHDDAPEDFGQNGFRRIVIVSDPDCCIKT